VLDVETDNGRTTSAAISPNLVAFQIPDSDDWYSSWPFIFFGESKNSTTYYYPSGVGDKLDLSNWIMDDKKPNLVLSGPTNELKYRRLRRLISMTLTY
jgi:hypothetical protein